MECDGYDRSLSNKPPSQPRQIMPQSSTRLPDNITPATAMFKNQSEYQYFQHFRNEITLDLSGAISQPMWSFCHPSSLQRLAPFTRRCLLCSSAEHGQRLSIDGQWKRPSCIRRVILWSSSSRNSDIDQYCKRGRRISSHALRLASHFLL